jgi:hypothetical protein
MHLRSLYTAQLTCKQKLRSEINRKSERWTSIIDRQIYREQGIFGPSPSLSHNLQQRPHFDDILLSAK